jgi:hypothetical protein
MGYSARRAEADCFGKAAVVLLALFVLSNGGAA